MRAEDVVGSDSSAAETAVDGLHLHGLAANLRGSSAEADLSRHQFFQMNREGVAHRARGSKPTLRFIFNRAHQYLLHLARQRRCELTWPRILLKVENQKRIVLRVGTGQQMKQGGAEAVNIRTWFNSSAKKFGRRVTHGAYRSHAFLFLLDPASNAKIDQHHATAVAVNH